MKKFACFILLVGISCHNPTGSVNLNGAYSMLTQSLKDNSMDTIFKEEKQLKIYADSFMMYVGINAADAVSAFGVGTFSIDSGRLTEKIMYSATDSIQNRNTLPGTANITPNDTGYEQVISKTMSDKSEIRFTEAYRSVGTNAKSVLDGIWKQVSSYTIMGSDTIKHSDTEYKSFYAGNFAYGDFYTDSSQQKNTGISYGTFSIDSSDHLTEIITVSTWPELTGKTFTLDIILNGNDSFTQIATMANGLKEVSVYERLRKQEGSLLQ